jgi:hypothetical protein
VRVSAEDKWLAETVAKLDRLQSLADHFVSRRVDLSNTTHDLREDGSSASSIIDETVNGLLRTVQVAQTHGREAVELESQRRSDEQLLDSSIRALLTEVTSTTKMLSQVGKALEKCKPKSSSVEQLQRKVESTRTGMKDPRINGTSREFKTLHASFQSMTTQASQQEQEAAGQREGVDAARSLIYSYGNDIDVQAQQGQELAVRVQRVLLHGAYGDGLKVAQRLLSTTTELGTKIQSCRDMLRKHADQADQHSRGLNSLRGDIQRLLSQSADAARLAEQCETLAAMREQREKEAKEEERRQAAIRAEREREERDEQRRRDEYERQKREQTAAAAARAAAAAMHPSTDRTAGYHEDTRSPYGSPPHQASSSARGPLKKDGTPDMRYKANRQPTPSSATGPLRVDGMPDMRFKVNRPPSSSSAQGPLKKDGTPDMRYKANW